jgi:membrane dipeptidase
MTSAATDSPSRQPIIDCHSDVPIDVYRRRREGEHAVLLRHHLPEYLSGGVVGSVCTVGGDGLAQSPLGIDRPYESALAKLDALVADIAESDGAFEIVGSPAELESCVERGVFAIIPSLEGASPLQGDLTRIPEFYDRGLRVLGLCWNETNELAIGTDAGVADAGLTEIGAEAVALMNDLGIVIDLAHASKQTFMDVAEVSRAPLFVSHSNAQAVYMHVRNLDQEQLDAVAGSGGVVGVCFYSPFIGAGHVTVAHLVDHVAYLVETIGVGSVVLGPDFIDYAHPEMMLEVARHPNVYPVEVEYAEGVETVRSLQNVIGAMAERGLDPAAIDRIARANFLQLFEETQALARVSASAD